MMLARYALGELPTTRPNSPRASPQNSPSSSPAALRKRPKHAGKTRLSHEGVHETRKDVVAATAGAPQPQGLELSSNEHLPMAAAVVADLHDGVSSASAAATPVLVRAKVVS